jgi:GntR family transcriptional repressor for pyruvate dehydrogenase complex
MTKMLELQKLVEILRAQIVDGKALPAERQLAEQTGVKRHQIRRALDVLRTEGELARSNIGRSVTPFRGREALVRGTNSIEVIELRLALEPALARLAAVRASPLDIARIQRAATTSPEVEYGAWDLKFHNLVAAAARNTLAADFYTLLRQVGADARLHVHNPRPNGPERVKQRDSEHQAIADAIASRDPDRAEAAMRTHLAAVQQVIMNRMPSGATVIT